MMHIKFKIEPTDPELFYKLSDEYERIVYDLWNQAIKDSEFPKVRISEIRTDFIASTVLNQAKRDAYVFFIKQENHGQIPVFKKNYFAMCSGFKLIGEYLTMTVKKEKRQFIPVVINVASFFKENKQIRMSKLEIAEESGEWFATIYYKFVEEQVKKPIKRYKKEKQSIGSSRIIV